MGIAVEEIEKVVAELSPNQLRRFRSWYENLILMLGVSKLKKTLLPAN